MNVCKHNFLCATVLRPQWIIWKGHSSITGAISLVPRLSITRGRKIEPCIKRSRMRQILHTFHVNRNM